MEKISQHPNTFYRVSLKAVIRNSRGEVLVVKEGSSDWSLPGGGWDHGETERDCLARELHEEVGYRGTFSFRPIATQPMYMPHKLAWLLWIVYEVTIPDVDNVSFTVGHDAEEIAWRTPASFATPAAESERWIYNNLQTIS